MEALQLLYSRRFCKKNPPKTGISGPKTQFLALDDDDEIFKERRGRLFVKEGGGGGGFPSNLVKFLGKTSFRKGGRGPFGRKKSAKQYLKGSLGYG